MGKPIVVDQLIENAQKATGLTDFGGETWREGLEVLVKDVNADTDRPDEFVARNAGQYTKILMDRLQVINAIKERPEVLDEKVETPLFVFGLPRTGTTLLSNLLAADPARRSALTWELNDPVPPPTTETLFTDPRCLAALEQERQMLAANPGINKVYRMSAVYPYECVAIMAHEFCTLMLESAGKLPNYLEWFMAKDKTEAYRYHKKWLQLHQIDAPGIWNLKMPSHILDLEALLTVYPDAKLVWTHRDPYTVMGSFCSIISMGHQGMAGRIDAEWIGQDMTYQAQQHVDRGMASRARMGHDRIVDSHYADTMRDPMGAMRKLYADLGDELTPEAEAAMQAWLDDNPQGKFGKHEYKLAEYGLSKEKLEPVFARYLSEYDVEMEG